MTAQMLHIPAQQIQPNGAEPVQNNPEGELQYRKITDLRQHYLEKHRETIAPLQWLNYSIALIVAVAVVIFSNLAGLPAFLLGAGVMGIFCAVGQLFLDPFHKDTDLCRKLNMNRTAAHALITPGFYEAIMLSTPHKLATAESIVKAHEHFALNLVP